MNRSEFKEGKKYKHPLFNDDVFFKACYESDGGGFGFGWSGLRTYMYYGEEQSPLPNGEPFYKCYSFSNIVDHIKGYDDNAFYEVD